MKRIRVTVPEFDAQREILATIAATAVATVATVLGITWLAYLGCAVGLITGGMWLGIARTNQHIQHVAIIAAGQLTASEDEGEG